MDSPSNISQKKEFSLLLDIGKKEEKNLDLLFRRNKWLTRNGKKHILFDLEVLI